MTRVVCLVENTAGKAGLLGEHGLAMWIETAGRKVLFDTGQGLVIAHNARQLGVDLARADAIVLSHGHYDHTGGLAAALGAARNARLYAHPEAFRPRFACDRGGTARAVGIPATDEEAVRANAGRLVATSGPTEVGDGLFATGPIRRRIDCETTSGPFFLDSDCRYPDGLEDDQALFFECDGGIAVLLGCAHAGVINTLATIRDLMPGRAIQVVVGGMHLHAADRKRIRRTRAALREQGVKRAGPCHCTGLPATVALWHEFGRDFVSFRPGTVLEL